jgi:transposase
VDPESRQGEDFKCLHCDHEIDADWNASINIARLGIYSSQSPKS